jgi:ApaG protein
MQVSDTTTNGIRVTVTSAYLPERSSPQEGEFFFTYHVTIANVGSETAQLISRHWVITNANGEEQIVDGPGVVGQQPTIEPGGTFEYTSFSRLSTSMGVMHGSYTLVTPVGDTIEAQIAPFTLAAPNALN